MFRNTIRFEVVFLVLIICCCCTGVDKSRSESSVRPDKRLKNTSNDTKRGIIENNITGDVGLRGGGKNGGQENSSTAKRTLSNADRTAEYDAMLQKVQKGDLGVDFYQMRECYSKSKYYTPHVTTLEINSALSMIKGEEKIRKFEEIMAKCFVDPQVHMQLGVLYSDCPEKSRFHLQIMMGLMKSIMDASHDGLKPGTAFVVNSVSEEMAVFVMLEGSQIGFKDRKRRGTETYGGKPYDVFVMHDKYGAQRILYFDISRFYRKGVS